MISFGVRGGGREAQVVDRRAVDNESPLRITLVQGVARGEKMDLILQKATELGIDAVVPVQSDRSEVKLDGERAQKRLAHWTSVVVAACEQSGRARVPAVAAAAPLSEALQALPPGGRRLLLDPFADANTQSLGEPADRRIVLAVGPEGGWSARDRSVLETAGFSGIRLGPRVLRTETAGAAASAIAAIPEVRSALKERQRAFRQAPGLVADGRDMGTVIFPDAGWKVFLTASAEERAERRYKQLKDKGVSVTLDGLLREILARDARDASRAVAPLRPAEDAVRIDTTGQGIEAVVERVLALVPGRAG